MKITIEQAMNRLIPQQKSTSGMRQVKQRVNVEYVKSLDENDSLLLFKKNDTYVLSPADDELDPIIGEFDEIPDDNSIPPAFSEWINSYSNEIKTFQECGATNNIELVDLGLTSGTKWANMNIGASSPYENGEYYAWGEIDTKKNYVTSEYKYYNTETKTYTKLGNISKKPEYDVAYKLNKGWCIPSLAQGQELLKECKWEVIKLDNGISIWRATGPNGNYIDFPFNGCISESSKLGYTWNAYLWLSDELSNGSQGRCLKLLQSTTSIYNMYKRSGGGIRPVSSGEIDEKPTTNNKIKLVDLGLSVDWADVNLGASKPEEPGYFYSWGETEPKTSFSWANYKWNDSVGSTYKSKDLGSNISKKNEHDPAYLNDKNMCLPTDAQWQELLDRCTWTYTKVNDRNVYKVTGPNGNSIIIPLAGYKNSGTTLIKDNEHGCYMSSSIYSTNTNQYSKTIDFEVSSKKIGTTRKMVGRSVRPVSTKIKNTKRYIEPFMPFKLGQGDPWNNALPLDPKDGKRVITGCTNTSMTQIFLYYGLIGTNGKTWRRTIPEVKSFTTCPGTANQQVMPDLPELEVDYDSINFYKSGDFAKSKNPKGYEMIGKLMKQIGCINKTRYRSTSSTASISDALITYKNILHLAPNPRRIQANIDGLDTFINLVYSELEKGYPVNMYGFAEDGNSGHAFICDGYNPETDKFHFDWGWDGSYNGWFSMSALKLASSTDFTYFKQAIINIYPESIPYDVNQDKSINITDVMVIVQDIVNKKIYDYKKDLNQDGKINEEDIQILINYILGR